ncbi:MAG: N-6 DNA methylase [Xanthobacteraceae bacterium]
MKRAVSPKEKIIVAAERTHSGRFTDLDADKLRGGYYTSPEIAAWLAAWAIRTPNDRVLEPSCGDGEFLTAAVHRFGELGLRGPSLANLLTGVEIFPQEADHARSRLRSEIGARVRDVVETGDFFAWWTQSTQPAFDVVIGNPPFIRYQTFPEPHRGRAIEIMKSLGLTPNKLTNIWVPFVVAAVASLRPNGRLALVLPAELLQVTYAGQLRSFLTDRFRQIDIVACNELIFEKAEQEVVLLLADGALTEASSKNVCRVAMTETKTVADILSQPAVKMVAASQPKTISHDSEKWLKYFLSAREIAFMRELRASKIAAPLSKHASIDVGVVTGKNEFFVLTGDQIDELGIEKYTIPLVSRSIQLKGARINKTDWKALAAAGDRVYLLDLAPHAAGKLPAALKHYIRTGETKGVHSGFKCSIRTPWYAVPSIWNPDGFLFRQIYDFPRMVLNQAGATSTDTIHRLRSNTAKPERVIANTYTWMTAASAEIEGRSYGGGVLELEPTEAERLLVPAQLNGALALAEADKLTRAGRLDTVLEENAKIVLMGHMGMSRRDCEILRDIWFKMRDRRMARRRRPRQASSTATA